MSNVVTTKYALRSTRYHNSIMIDICDLQLIGRRLEEEGLIINLSKEYYQQEIIEQSRARDLLKVCEIANLVGKQIVEQALEMRMAKQGSIRMISGIPFLMIYRF
jgi:uncharacterized protein